MASRISGITIQIGGDTTGLNKALSSTNKQISSTQKSLKDVERLLKLDPSNVELLSQKQQLLTRNIIDTSNKLKTLKEAEKQVQEQFKKGQVSEDQYNSLKREIIATELSLSDLENKSSATEDALKSCAQTSAKEFDALSDEVDKSDAASKNAADGGFTILKGALADLAADGIQKVVSSFKELSIEGEAAMDKLQAATGVSDAQMDQYKDTIKSVYSDAYGDSLEDVSEAGKEIINIMGELDNTDFKRLLTNSLALRDIYDFDVRESLRAVKSLMDQFGISSDAAYNLIVQGAQNGLNQNDDLLDTINEYSVQFKNAGYSASDMFNMLSNGADQGTWSIDKLGDAVKEFGIRLSDGTANDELKSIGLDADKINKKFAEGGESARQATQLVLNGLISCDDAQKQYMVGQALFGTMWEDLGIDAVTSLMNTKGAIDDTNAAMAEADATAYDNVNTSLDTLQRTIGMDLSNALNGLLELLEPLFTWLNDNTWAVYLVVGAIGALAIGMGAYTAVQWAANSAMLACPLTWIVAAIAALVAIIIVCINYWDEISSAASDAWDAICNAFSDAGDWIYNNVVKPIGDFFSELFDGIVYAGKMAWWGIQVGLISMVNFVIKCINGLIKGVLAPINLLINGLNLIPGVDIPELKFEIPTFDLPEMPKMAKGGILRDGTAIVGEAGPELLTQIGSKTIVTPLDNAQRAAGSAIYGGGPVNVNIGTFNNYDSDQDINTLSDMISERIAFKTGRAVAASGR